MRRSGKFESVEVRKRYRSLEATDQAVIIIIVSEHPGVETGGVMPGPMKRLGNASMVLPILDYVDGYGFTAGGRFSFVNVLGKEGHIILPMTFGSTRQVTAELDKTIAGGPVRRLRLGGSVISRENPGYDIRDRRNEVWVDALRPVAGVLSVGASAGWSDVHFGETTDRLTTYGARVVLDTRLNPGVPARRDLRERRVDRAGPQERPGRQPVPSRSARVSGFHQVVGRGGPGAVRDRRCAAAGVRTGDGGRVRVAAGVPRGIVRRRQHRRRFD